MGKFEEANLILRDTYPQDESQENRKLSMKSALAERSGNHFETYDAPEADSKTDEENSLVDVMVYPNPFNPEANILFETATTEFVSVKVFDSLGRLVQLLVGDTLPAGKHYLHFNGSSLPSGMYILNVELADTRSHTKMLLLR